MRLPMLQVAFTFVIALTVVATLLAADIPPTVGPYIGPADPEALHKHSYFTFPQVSVIQQQRQSWATYVSKLQLGTCISLDGPRCLSGEVQPWNLAPAEETVASAEEPTSKIENDEPHLGHTLHEHVQDTLQQMQQTALTAEPSKQAETSREETVSWNRKELSEDPDRLTDLDNVIKSMALSLDLPPKGMLQLAETLRHTLARVLVDEDGSQASRLSDALQSLREAEAGKKWPRQGSPADDDYEDYAEPATDDQADEITPRQLTALVVQATEALFRHYIHDADQGVFHLDDGEPVLNLPREGDTAQAYLQRRLDLMHSWYSQLKRVQAGGRVTMANPRSPAQVDLEERYLTAAVWEFACDAVVDVVNIDGGWSYLRAAFPDTFGDKWLDEQQQGDLQEPASSAKPDGWRLEQPQAADGFSQRDQIPEEAGSGNTSEHVGQNEAESVEGTEEELDEEDYPDWTPEDMQALLDHYNDAYNDTLTAWPDYSDAGYV
ncbi:hypothetical protein WJX72_011340 [[Myrmecia] bisecta]|uniref:Uncharacterized protein n=1 Tax=[Myrmecia] bisecta TaxID=41462 RepID=A0AAW1QGP3_9CHLO